MRQTPVPVCAFGTGVGLCRFGGVLFVCVSMFGFLPAINLGHGQELDLLQARSTDDGATSIDFFHLKTEQEDGTVLISHVGIQGRADHLKHWMTQEKGEASKASTATVDVAPAA